MRRIGRLASAAGLALGLALALGAPATAGAQECFIGEVRLFAGNFAPRNWAMAHGQLLNISQNQALFSIVGTLYGGDGRTTFGLPDLRGRVPVGEGAGPGLSNRQLGERGGNETHQLTPNEMPVHDHDVRVRGTKPSNRDRSKTPEDRIPSHGNHRVYTDMPPDAQMAPGTISPKGGGAPHNNMPPFLGMNYIICTQGLFPIRN